MRWWPRSRELVKRENGIFLVAPTVAVTEVPEPVRHDAIEQNEDVIRKVILRTLVRVVRVSGNLERVVVAAV